jgi:hypothetical protein
VGDTGSVRSFSKVLVGVSGSRKAATEAQTVVRGPRQLLRVLRCSSPSHALDGCRKPELSCCQDCARVHGPRKVARLQYYFSPPNIFYTRPSDLLCSTRPAVQSFDRTRIPQVSKAASFWQTIAQPSFRTPLTAVRRAQDRFSVSNRAGSDGRQKKLPFEGPTRQAR